MKAFFRKLLSLSLAISTLFCSSNLVLADDELIDDTSISDEESEGINTVTSSGTDINFFEDFENYAKDGSSEYLTVHGSTWYTTDVDAEHGASIALQTSAQGYLSRIMPERMTSGKWHLEFEYQNSNNTEGRMHMVLHPDDTTNVQPFGVEKDYTSYFVGAAGYTFRDAAARRAFKNNTWVKYDAWFDLDAKRYYLCINGELVGSTTLPATADGIYQLRFRGQSVSGDGELVHIFDNIGFRKVDEEGLKELKARGKNVPKSFEENMLISISTKQIGNIFFNDFNSVEADISFLNRGNKKFSGNVTYEVFALNGERVWNGAESVTADVNEAVVKTIRPKVSKYDIYTLRVTAKDESGETCVLEREFSVANRSYSKNKDRRIGIVGHMHKGQSASLAISEPVNIMPLLDATGIGWLREGFYPSQYLVYDNTGKAEWSHERLTNIYETILTKAQEYNINILAFVSNVGTEKEKLYPEMYALTSHLKPYGVVKAYQFGNEMNNHGRTAMNPIDVYVDKHKEFNRAVKDVDPEALTVTNSTSRADAGWIEWCFREGIAGHTDGVSIHPYIGTHPPEVQRWTETAGQVRKRLAEIGQPQIKIFQTEGLGSTSLEGFSEQQQGEVLVREFAANNADNAVDVYMTYQIQTDDYSVSNNESCFGILRGFGVENAYGAKPAYLAHTNYFAMTADHEYKKEGYIVKDGVRIHRYEDKLNAGENTFMMYTTRDITPISVNFGVNEGTLYDIYGNATKLYSDDGVFNFNLTDSPVYFEVKSDKAEIVETKITQDKTLVTLPVQTKGEFTFDISPEYDCEISARETLNAEIKRDGNKAVITVCPSEFPEKVDYYLRDHSDGHDEYRDYVKVTLTKDGKTYSEHKVAVSYLPKKVEAHLTVRPYNEKTDKHFVGVIEVKNLSDDVISGTLQVKSPESIASEFGQKRIDNLAPGEVRNFEFNIPEILNYSKILYSGVFTADSGEESIFDLGAHPRSTYYHEASTLQIKTIKKADKAPVIDANITMEEWEEGFWGDLGTVEIAASNQNLVIDGVVVAPEDIGRLGVPFDLEGKVYVLYDDKYLYVAANVIDDVHYQEEQPQIIYRDDVLSVYSVPSQVQRHNTRFDFGLTTFYNAPVCFLNWSPFVTNHYAKEYKNGEEGILYDIKRVGVNTVYEVAIPIEKIVGKTPEKYQNFSFSLGINDYDITRTKTKSFGGWVCLGD